MTWLQALGAIAAVLFVQAMRHVARRRAWQQGPHYVEQIQILKTDSPLALPAIKPLMAVVAKKRRTRKPKPPVEFRRTGTN